MSLTQVLISAVTGGVLSLIAVILYSRWDGNGALKRSDAVLVAVVVGVSILLWREAGNTGVLNEDPIPPVSPNDVLCPIVTYVCLNVLAGLRASLQRPAWGRMCALLTLVSFVVNVVTI